LNSIDLEFRYYELSAEEKARLLDFLRKKLEGIDDIIFAYVHVGFLERSFFRDVDVAVWISDVEKAFYYTVNFSAKLEVEGGLPVDLHVLNEAPLPFKHHVFTTGMLLFSKDEELRHRIVDQTIKEYIDLKLKKKLSTEKIGSSYNSFKTASS
jgi:predicted nucleotidyltransferase